MKSKRIVAASVAAVLSLGLAAGPVVTAQADPPGNGIGRSTASKAELKQAWATLKAALTAANRQFVMAVHQAQTDFRTSTQAQRAALVAVLDDPERPASRKPPRWFSSARTQPNNAPSARRRSRRQQCNAKRRGKLAWQEFRAAVR